MIAALAALDQLVVISHDDDLAGAALEAALSGPVGYIGGLGSRRTQQSRADWLAYRGVTDLEPGARPGRPGHRREHAGRDRRLDPRRGARRTVGRTEPGSRPAGPIHAG